QQRIETLDVPGDGAEACGARLLGAAEAEVVGHDDPVPGGSQRADEVAVDESPGGVAVHEHDRAAAGWAFVDVVHSPIRRGEPTGPVRPRAAERPVRAGGHSASHW